MIRKARSAFDFIVTIFFVLSCVIFLLSFLSILLDVFLRTFFDKPQIWVTESVAYSLLFITFLSTTWLLRNDSHVNMDWLSDRISLNSLGLLRFCTSICAVAAFLILTWFSGALTWELYVDKVNAPSELAPLQYPIVGIIPIGSFLLCVQSAFKASDNFKLWRKPPISKNNDTST